LPAYSASAKVICFMEKLGWRDRRISPGSGSLFQTIPKEAFFLRLRQMMGQVILPKSRTANR
ncbi:hypothetical protein, partial [Stutzerimonas kunmingensis]|uniref:hypothetical protein n=1 Tax=Stutzerimonas kunmingensis TaxID=1211807 RepID=UPI00242DBCD8